MKLKSLFKILTTATRIGGIFPYDDRGRPTGWFAVTLIYTAAYIYGQILFWGKIGRFEKLKGRPFTLLVTAMEISSQVASLACYAIQNRRLVNLEKLQAFEKQNKIAIDYDVKWIIFNICVLPLGHIFKYTLVFWFYGSKDAVPRILGYFLPRIITQFGEMYYCSTLRILHQQLSVLCKSKMNSLQRMVWHSYLVNLCNSIHQTFRFHLVFGVLKMIAGSIRSEMQLSEGYLTCLNVGGKFCSNYLFATLISEILDYIWILYSLTQTCYHVKNQANDCFQHDMELQMRKNKPKLDVRVAVYASRLPQFNTNVDDFFDLSPNLFLKIVAQSVLFYLLMLQLKVMRPWDLD